MVGVVTVVSNPSLLVVEGWTSHGSGHGIERTLTGERLQRGSGTRRPKKKVVGHSTRMTQSLVEEGYAVGHVSRFFMPPAGRHTAKLFGSGPEFALH